MAAPDGLAVTLVRCLYHVAQNPKVRDRLEEEVDDVLGGHQIAAADYESLPYARAILMEAVRLGHLAYSVNRGVLEDYAVQDYVIPKGTFMEFCFGAAQCA